MNRIELVSRKLAGERSHILAKGEFFLEDNLAKKLTEETDSWQAKKNSVLMLDWDFVAEPVDKLEGSYDFLGRVDLGQRGYDKPVYSSMEDLCENFKYNEATFKGLGRWKKETEVFVFALIDGPFQTLSSLLDYNQFLMDTMLKPDLLKRAVEIVENLIKNLIDKSLEEGADGIIIGEDIAYSKSLIISPKILKEVFFPVISSLVSDCNKPVVFHSDGNLKEILPDLVQTGIAGLHSLEEDAGMNIKEVRKLVGDQLCLLGGFDLKHFYDADEKNFETKVKDFIKLGQECEPYIFGTSAGILDNNLCPEKVRIAYSF